MILLPYLFSGLYALIKLSNGSLIIKGEKKEDKEEMRKGYYSGKPAGQN
jgi:HSP20 family molecular chaperone IbpA